MQSTTSSTISLVAGITFALLLTLVFAMLVGCDSNNGKERSLATTIESESSRPMPASAPIVETTPSLVETESLISSPPVAPKPVTYEEAESAFDDRRYTEAAQLFAAYSEAKGENPWGHYMLGLSAWKSGDFETAESAFLRAVELDPEHVKSRLNLCRVYLDSKRADEALVRVEEALELDPGFAVSYRLLGRAFHELDRLEEAADAYREALRIDSEDAWAMNNLALVLIEEGFFELAISPLARATELRTDIALFYNNLGMALEHSGYFRAAEEAYGNAIAIDDSYEKALQNFARVEFVEEDAQLIPIDLQTMSQDFVAEIVSWSDENIPREQPFVEPAENETTSLIQPDSVAVQIENKN